MAKHIHVHLHDAAMPSSTPKAPPRTPSGVIRPTSGAPKNPPKNKTPIKPTRAASSVIKGAPHAAVKGVHLVTKGAEGLNEGIRKVGELSESKI